jgi:hypothetical protein
MKYSEAGKGSAPRKQQDHDAYARGWDAIFRRNRGQTETPETNPAKDTSHKQTSKAEEKK